MKTSMLMFACFMTSVCTIAACKVMETEDVRADPGVHDELRTSKLVLVNEKGAEVGLVSATGYGVSVAFGSAASENALIYDPAEGEVLIRRGRTELRARPGYVTQSVVRPDGSRRESKFTLVGIGFTREDKGEVTEQAPDGKHSSYSEFTHDSDGGWLLLQSTDEKNSVVLSTSTRPFMSLGRKGSGVFLLQWGLAREGHDGPLMTRLGKENEPVAREILLQPDKKED